jgi:hypothetical protein
VGSKKKEKEKEDEGSKLKMHEDHRSWFWNQRFSRLLNDLDQLLEKA